MCETQEQCHARNKCVRGIDPVEGVFSLPPCLHLENDKKIYMEKLIFWNAIILEQISTLPT